jgi:hypothetical protein
MIVPLDRTGPSGDCVFQRSTPARRVLELPRFGIEAVLREIHHLWIGEVTVSFLDRNQEAIVRPADDSRFSSAMLVAVSPA